MAKGRISPGELKRDPLMTQYINTTKLLKSNSQSLVKWATIGAIVLAVVLIGWLFFSRRSVNAGEAMAEAFLYHNATVADPIPANVKGYAFTTQDEKDRKSYDAFTKAANDYPSYNGEIGRLYAATHQLNFDPEKAEVTIREMAQKDSEIGAQAKLLLAGRLNSSGKFDEAIAEFNKLKTKPYSIPTQLLDANIAEIYEAQGKVQQAVDIYFGIAKDEIWRSTPIGIKAANRLSVLSPEKYDQVPDAKSASPLAGLGSMMQ